MPNYQAGKDALLGEPGGDAAIAGTRHTPAPLPGMAVPGLPAPRPMSAEDAATLRRGRDDPRSGLPKRVV
jgi:hypothetical protein